MLRRAAKPRSSKPPTRAEALALLRDHARSDPQAAIKLAEQMNGQELLEQARRLTTDEGAARLHRSSA